MLLTVATWIGLEKRGVRAVLYGKGFFPFPTAFYAVNAGFSRRFSFLPEIRKLTTRFVPTALISVSDLQLSVSDFPGHARAHTHPDCIP